MYYSEIRGMDNFKLEGIKKLLWRIILALFAGTSETLTVCLYDPMATRIKTLQLHMEHFPPKKLLASRSSVLLIS
jgi:hypothetical protein